jgi:hypothetical protein
LFYFFFLLSRWIWCRFHRQEATAPVFPTGFSDSVRKPKCAVRFSHPREVSRYQFLLSRPGPGRCSVRAWIPCCTSFLVRFIFVGRFQSRSGAAQQARRRALAPAGTIFPLTFSPAKLICGRASVFASRAHLAHARRGASLGSRRLLASSASVGQGGFNFGSVFWLALFDFFGVIAVSVAFRFFLSHPKV